MMYLFYNKRVLQKPFNEYFGRQNTWQHRDSNLKLVSSIQGMVFLTGICIFLIDHFAPIVGQCLWDRRLYIQFTR